MGTKKIKTEKISINPVVSAINQKRKNVKNECDILAQIVTEEDIYMDMMQLKADANKMCKNYKCNIEDVYEIIIKIVMGVLCNCKHHRNASYGEICCEVVAEKYETTMQRLDEMLQVFTKN